MAKRIVRYTNKARMLHLVNLITFVIFFYTGASLLTPSLNFLAHAIGGFSVARLLHRAATVILLSEILISVIFNFKSTKQFLKETFQWQKADTQWMMKFVLWLFKPSTKMPHTSAKASAGERFVAWFLLAGIILMIKTGFILLFRTSFSKNIVLWATTLHDVGFFLLTVLLIGHIYIGLGLFKPYRGVTSGMLGDGTVDEELAKRLWPDWAKKAEVSE